MKFALALLAGVAIAGSAVAEPEFNLSGGYTILDGDDGSLGAITGRGTVFFNQNFGFEGEASFGVQDEDVGVGTLELNNQLAAFGIAKLPVNEQFDVFGRVGYGTSEFEASIPGVGSDSADVDGFMFGGGAQYFFTPTFGVRGDYTRFEADEDGFDGGADQFAISAVFRFK